MMAVRTLTRFAMLAGLSAAYAPLAWGQASPQITPGAMGEQMQRQQQQLEEQRRLQEQLQQQQQQGPLVTGPAAPGTALPLAPGVTFDLRGVQFGNSAFLTPQQLSDTAAPFVGHKIAFADLQTIIDGVNKLYEQRGLITARAVLPPQKVANGIVRIDLVEGKVGAVKVKGNDYTDSGFVTDRVPLASGEVVDPAKLQSMLSAFNRTYDINARAALQPGAAFGLTDIELSIQEPKQDTLDLFADDEAFDGTGRYEGGAYFRHIGLLGIDDHLSAYMTGSSGSINGNLSYDLPFDAEGGRAGASYGRGTTEIIAGTAANAHSTGKSQNYSANVGQPIWVGDDWTLTGSGTLGAIDTTNYISGKFLSSSTTYRAGLGLSLSVLTPGRSISFAASAVGAHSNLSEPLHNRDYVLYNGTFSWIEAITQEMTATLTGGWQVTPARNLPSDELFQIGGATSVRGYQQGVVAGDGGYYGDLQLNHTLDWALKGLAGYVFADAGRVTTVSPQPKGIYGTGVGLSWNGWEYLSTDLSVGVPLAKINGQNDYRIYGRVVLHVL